MEDEEPAGTGNRKSRFEGDVSWDLFLSCEKMSGWFAKLNLDLITEIFLGRAFPIGTRSRTRCRTMVVAGRVVIRVQSYETEPAKLDCQDGLTGCAGHGGFVLLLSHGCKLLVQGSHEHCVIPEESGRRVIVRY